MGRGGTLVCAQGELVGDAGAGGRLLDQLQGFMERLERLDREAAQPTGSLAMFFSLFDLPDGVFDGGDQG